FWRAFRSSCQISRGPDMGDRKILIAGFIVLGLAVTNAWAQQKPATRPIEGSLLAILLLALLAAFGEKQAALAGNFAMLVALTASITELPAIFQRIGVS